jgi:hypothetical protein
VPAVQQVVAVMTRFRFTAVLASLVVSLWTVMLAMSPAQQSAIVHANSTNVDNLLGGRIYTLLTSAVVLGSRAEILGVAAMVVLLVVAERAWGWLRVGVVFLFGHIVATLLVFAGLATGMAMHTIGAGLATADDVGISYGTVAVLGGLLAYQPWRRRRWWQALAVVVAVATVITLRDFTSIGHLTALVLGFAAGHLLRHQAPRRSISRRPMPRHQALGRPIPRQLMLGRLMPRHRALGRPIPRRLTLGRLMPRHRALGRPIPRRLTLGRLMPRHQALGRLNPASANAGSPNAATPSAGSLMLRRLMPRHQALRRLMPRRPTPGRLTLVRVTLGLPVLRN